MFGTIRQKIIDVITAQADEIQEVHRTEVSEIDGWPACTVAPSESEAEYNETSADSTKLFYNFRIRIIYPFVEGQDEADIALEAAVDELLGIFQTRTVLGDVCDWVRPTPSIWGYQNRGDGQNRVAEIRLQCVRYT